MIIIKEYPRNYRIRASGWIQDAARFDNLHRFVSLFDRNSFYRNNLINKIKEHVVLEKKEEFLEIISSEKIEISYKDIVGKSPKGSRTINTVCNGLGQVVLEGQKRNFQGDWSTDSFLRWAEILQFIEYNVEADKYSISDIGLKYASMQELTEQKKIIARQLLMYSPVTRILSLLESEDYTKFELGENLGFIGEKGFTFTSQELFTEIYLFANDKDRKKIKANLEASCDKYSRQICSWLEQLGLINFRKKSFSNGKGTLQLRSYSITPLGKNFLRKSRKSAKYIPFGMLSIESRNRELHCKRRALILKSLSESNKTVPELKKILENYQIDTFNEQIEDDLSSFLNIGLNIKNIDEYYCLRDRIIGLVIPNRIEIILEDEIEKIKKEFRKNLKNIDHDLLNLIDYSYSKKSARWFEVYVAKAYKNISKETYLLGGASRPDVISIIKDITFIIDAKSYKDGFKLPISERDKMVRYIEEYKNGQAKWVRGLENNNYIVGKLSYQFVSSSFDRNIQKKLMEIDKRTELSGSALTAAKLLLIVDDYIGSGYLDLDKLLDSRYSPLNYV